MGMQKRDVGLIVMAILSAALIVPAFSSAQKKNGREREQGYQGNLP